jgi:hypothetical protein
MARRIIAPDLETIEAVVRRHPEGLTVQEIADALVVAPPRRTLQYRLKSLVSGKRLIARGKGPAVRYFTPAAAESELPRAEVRSEREPPLRLTKEGDEIRAHVRKPTGKRTPAGYDRAFLDSYRPNESFYLSPAERKHLRDLGTPKIAPQPAGTYARQILNRLLIDLSWNSSRLEGNTYSLLDTRRLIDFGEEAQGKQRAEAQMILNHKDAIEFLTASPDDIGFNRYTVLNLHALLANNLLPDPMAAGRLRHIGVGITGSVFHPLEVPQLVEECFDQVLATAAAIADPFEQALFVMVQIPYLQPFDDVNKRVSRLSANIPLIKQNLSPLSFTDVPRDTYTEAMLGVYEMRRVALLRDVFIWAYERSADRYAAVRQSLGEPDPFRLRHRAALREIIAAIVQGRMGKKAAVGHIGAWTRAHIEPAEREQFRALVEDELLGLHEGNFARYQIRPAEFAAWREAWNIRAKDG